MSAWLPAGKRAAVCLSVDDVHPAPVAFEALGHLRALQDAHPQLRATLFTTPDWRTIEPYANRGLLRHVPFVRDRVFLAPVHAAGTYRLDRHPAFVAYLRDWNGIEVALHGLHHVRKGRRPIHEFHDRSAAQCADILESALAIFDAAGLPVIRGVAPPGWEAPPPLLEALEALQFRFVASARDLDTPVSPSALTAGSGLRGVPLIHPHRVGALVHLTTNFQATSTAERALAIVEAGGLLSIKAHLLAESGTYRALDGLTDAYREHLHAVLSAIEERWGDAIWWPSMSEVAGAVCGSK